MEHVKTTSLTLHERLTTIGIKYWTLVCLLASIDILGPLATDAYLPSLPHMTLDLNTSPSWIQFTILSYSFIMAISSLFGGILSDKYGRRNMTLFGLFIFICGAFGCTFSSSIWILNICRFIQGIGGGISSIITSSVARDVFLANERMKILGILGSIRPIGIGIAPMIGGYISTYYGWRMVFFIIACFALFVMLFSLYLLPETKNRFFVNYNQIRILQTETNIIGNIDIDFDTSTNININNTNIIVVDTSNTSNESDTSDGSDIIVVDQDSTTSNSNSTELCTYSNNNYWQIIKVACTDSILMSVSWMIAFQMVGVFIFLNEFPYVSQNDYHYSQGLTGLMIGSGAIFTIFGACLAVTINKQSMMNSTTETSTLLFQLSPKNAKLSIMRLASIAALIACLLLIIPPIVMHYSILNEMNLSLLNFMYKDNGWYFLVIPFCVLTFSQGLFIPPAIVVVLEPYPHIAASISAILQFWRIILPTITLIIVTQCLSFKTNDVGSLVIHFSVALCAFLCFVLMYGCISGHDVRLRMCGWQDRIDKSQTQTYGTLDETPVRTNTVDGGNKKGVSVMQSLDVSTMSAPVMDISTFSLYTNANTINQNQEYYNYDNKYDPFATSIPTMQF